MFDDRITKKARGAGEHVSLTCRNHQTLRWTTKNISPIGCRSIFFAGENSRGDGTKENTHGMIPSRQGALKMLADGHMLDRSDTTGKTALVDSPDTRQIVNDKYDELEQKYVFECACPGRDLMLDPMYDEMPDVDM